MRGQPVLRRSRPDRLDVILRMDAGDRGEIGARRGVARQHLKRLALERAFDRAQALRPLGMPLAHVVLEAGRVGDDERGRGFHILRCDFRSPEIEPHLSRSPHRKSIGDNVREWLMDRT